VIVPWAPAGSGIAANAASKPATSNPSYLVDIMTTSWGSICLLLVVQRRHI
jgi:hypothetical protein